MKRKHISLKTKLAAALLQMRRVTHDGRWELITPHNKAKQMTANQVVALFHFDHYPIPHAQGGPDEPWNIEPVSIAEHREKTAKIDIPQIAKTKRISQLQKEFRQRLLAPRDERVPKQSRWGKRPFPKTKISKRNLKP